MLKKECTEAEGVGFLRLLDSKLSGVFALTVSTSCGCGPMGAPTVVPDVPRVSRTILGVP